MQKVPEAMFAFPPAAELIPGALVEKKAGFRGNRKAWDWKEDPANSPLLVEH